MPAPEPVTGINQQEDDMDTRSSREQSISNAEHKRRAAAEHNARFDRGGVSAVAARGLIVAAGMGSRAARNAAVLKDKTSRSRPLVNSRHPNRTADAKNRGYTKIKRLLARAV